MDILITVGIFPPDVGGPASFVPKIAKKLEGCGHNIKVICLSDKKNSNYKDEHDVIRINRSLPILFRWIITIIKVFKYSKNSDIIFINGLAVEATIANLLSRKKVIRKIVGDPVWERAYNKKLTTKDFDEFQEDEHKGNLRIQQLIRNWSINKSDLIITPSEHLKDFVLHTGYKKKLLVINNGVDIVNIERDILQKNNINLIVVSRLVTQKNINKVIEAMSLIQNDNVILNIIGEGNELANLKNLVNEYKLGEKVNFLGKIKNEKIPDYLIESDIFIQASSYEGLPHSLLEAMNYELAVISTNVGGCEELLNTSWEEAERGYFIPIITMEQTTSGIENSREQLWVSVDPKDILLRIEHIVNNKDEAKEKAGKAKEYITRKHNFAINSKIYEEEIYKLVKENNE
tara:strand:+ start:723 stop:1931 length:1209 start_codon:yes stop_codon:yes gene_type:complete